MRITGRGHPAVRATHAKTLEFSPDAQITERATCVVATAVAPADRALAGPVRITIAAGGERAVVHARANPGWDPAGPAVVRRSPLRLPGTLATDADTAAADLPRGLVAALRDPSAEVVVDVEPVPGAERTLVLAAPASAPPGALAAELAAADDVVAQDAAARAFAGPAGAGGSGRTVVLAVDDLPGARVRLDGARLETLGLPPRLAVAAACPSRAPVVFLPEPAGPAALAGAPAGYRVVLAAGPDELPGVLARAVQLRGGAAATLAQRHTLPWPHDGAGPPALPVRETVWCCLPPAPERLDPRVDAAVRALLADGVPTRAAARALAELTGWPRRRAYDAVLALGAR